MKSEKLLYVTPRTIRYGVRTEGTFASSGDPVESTKIEAGEHQAGKEFDVSTGSWE